MIRLRLADPSPDLDVLLDLVERARARSLQDASRLNRRLSPHDIQSLLDPRTAVLVFWTDSADQAAIWLTHSAAGVRPLRAAPRNIPALLNQIQDPASSTWRTGAAELAGPLLEGLPPLTDPAIRNVIVVPDGALAMVPFEALRGPRGLLVECCAVSYLPAAGWLRRRPGASRPALPWKREIVAFGNPTAPHLRLLPGDELWASLPRSAEEAQAISRMVPGRTEVHVGADARKALFLALSGQDLPVVHLGTHAAVDQEVPDRSRLLFAPGGPTDDADYLFARETGALDLSRVDLATLSACETERGRLIRGEGVQSLGRAFLSAGAHATVTSLWRVPDGPAAEFMKQFYFHLGRGVPKAEALRAAKLRFLRSGAALSHPAYWASFVLSGDGAHSIPPVLSWTWLAAIPAVAVTVIAVARRSNRLRNRAASPPA